MKKVLSLLLAAAMLLGVTIPAFAQQPYQQSGSTSITTSVPEPVPTFTMHIPADVTIEYNSTQTQQIGEAYTSGWQNIEKMHVWVYTTCLVSGENYIPLSYSLKHSDETASGGTSARTTNTQTQRFYGSQISESGVLKLSCSVSNIDWDDAVPGDYTATLSFEFIPNYEPNLF